MQPNYNTEFEQSLFDPSCPHLQDVFNCFIIYHLIQPNKNIMILKNRRKYHDIESNPYHPALCSILIKIIQTVHTSGSGDTVPLRRDSRAVKWFTPHCDSMGVFCSVIVSLFVWYFVCVCFKNLVSKADEVVWGSKLDQLVPHSIAVCWRWNVCQTCVNTRHVSVCMSQVRLEHRHTYTPLSDSEVKYTLTDFCWICAQLGLVFCPFRSAPQGGGGADGDTIGQKLGRSGRVSP